MAVCILLAAPTHAQTLVYEETFDSGNGAMATPRLVNTYVGPAPNSVAYTADLSWLTACNGWVAGWNSPVAAAVPISAPHCQNQTNWNYGMSIAQALGMYRGQTAAVARNNLAVTAYTAANPINGSVILRNTVGIPFPAIPAGGSGRFATLRLTGAAVNCFANAPIMQFQYVNGLSETALGAFNLCTDGQNPQTIITEARGVAPAQSARVADYLPNGAGANILITGTTMTFSVRNLQPSGAGNDWAFDNFTVLDVSPTLSKSVPGVRYVGAAMPLTFTITNTAGDNQAKIGWGFTDSLPAGVVVAPTPGVTNTCAGTVTATAGAGTISIANGTLAAGTVGGTATTCTLTVNVVSNTVGVYNNVVNNGDSTADNISSSTGLNLALQTVAMEWVVNRLTITKISVGNTASFDFSGNNGIANHSITTTAAGAPGTAGAQQTLTVASTTANTTITETLPAGWALTGADCTGLAAGQSASSAGAVVTIPFAGLALQSGGRTVQCTITNTQLQADLSITKTNTPGVNGEVDQSADTLASGASTTYTLRVTNNGPTTITGAVVRDTPGAGIACPAGNAVTITGAGTPAGGPFTIANLTGAGITLTALASGQTAILSFACNVQ
ncbi:hypothetical protein ASE35_08580 [Lysobacter sp. Root916]|uniref:prealbumin-like fold domain-containing protein n=1 Tax=Lysobacter sp. Root916 TaxID=1736606 RepID=UPI00070D13CC|nr:DUF11 domain-containing protein [Lysobacter sp. Root916]KRD34777.1 hypothetical protein ASE35_08580 [Lysobacter sp. Root916]